MSKESKEGKKNGKRPFKPPKDKFKFPDINPMYLLTFIGLIIAGVSLYYTRKTTMKEEEEEEREKERKEEPDTPSSKPKDSVGTRPRSENKALKDQTTWTHSLHKDIKIQAYSHLMIRLKIKMKYKQKSEED